MASIYDFDGAFLNYRNKQRLNGGQIDPRVVGALAEADLNARYNDQKSRRALDLQEKSIDKNYELGMARMGQDASQFAQGLRAQKSTGGTNALLAAVGLIPSIAGAGKSLGLWGQEAPSARDAAQTRLLDAMANRMAQNTVTPTQPQTTPSMYNNLASGDVDAGFNQDFSNYNWWPNVASPELSNMGFDFSTVDSPIYAGMGDTGLELNTNTDWMKFFEGWF